MATAAAMTPTYHSFLLTMNKDFPPFPPGHFLNSMSDSRGYLFSALITSEQSKLDVRQYDGNLSRGVELTSNDWAAYIICAFQNRVVLLQPDHRFHEATAAIIGIYSLQL